MFDKRRFTYFCITSLACLIPGNIFFLFGGIEDLNWKPMLSLSLTTILVFYLLFKYVNLHKLSGLALALCAIISIMLIVGFGSFGGLVGVGLEDSNFDILPIRELIVNLGTGILMLLGTFLFSNMIALPASAPLVTIVWGILLHYKRSANKKAN